MSELQIFFQEACPENWDKMTECARTRFCDKCEKHVHDLTMYTPEEVSQLLLGGDGPACIRATMTNDGKVVTKPSAYGKTLSALVIAPALFSVLTAAAASHPEEGSIVGRFWQGREALTIKAKGERASYETKLDGDGYFRFNGLKPGWYTLQYIRNGTTIIGVEKIHVLAGQSVQSGGELLAKVKAPDEPPRIVMTGAPMAILPAEAKKSAVVGAQASSASASASASELTAPLVLNPKP